MLSVDLPTDESSSVRIGNKPDAKNASPTAVNRVTSMVQLVLTFETKERQEHGKGALNGDQPTPRQGKQ